MKSQRLVVLEKIFFNFFSDSKSMGANDFGAGPFFTPGAWLPEFIKRTTTQCYTHNIKNLGLVVSEKKTFFMFSHDAPGTGPVWTPVAWLAGFIKRTTIHCYTQNMKALGLVVLEKFFMFFPIVSLWELMTPGAGPF